MVTVDDKSQILVYPINEVVLSDPDTDNKYDEFGRPYETTNKDVPSVVTLAELKAYVNEGEEVTSDNISDATTVGKSVLTAADGAAARTAIGAGTSSLAVGTTASTAAAGNHNHAVTADVDSGLEAAANIQALAVALSARIKALEDAAGE